MRQITLEFIICNKIIKSHQANISSKYDAQPKSGIRNRDGRKDERAYRSTKKNLRKKREMEEVEQGREKKTDIA